MVDPDDGERATPDDGDLVRVLPHAHDQAGGNPPFGMVVGGLPVGGLQVVQAGEGLGIFTPQDLQRVSPDDVPPDALADILRRIGATPPDAGG